MSTSKIVKQIDKASTMHKVATYVPPVELVLAGLGIEKKDLEQDHAHVSSKYLKFLISKIAASADFDPAWYASAYPDVEGARLAGEISSLRSHFVRTGYLEGRLPSKPEFNPEWYQRHYTDIGQTFSGGDIKGLQNHFLSKGYYEGRAGVPELIAEAQEWMQPEDSSI
jgi:hypothetical protein